MKKIILLACGILLSTASFAQSDRMNVMKADMSGKYRQAFHESFTKELNSEYGLSAGYHGMVDFGGTFGIGDKRLSRYECNTTHGYQFNPYFFLGAGLGLHFISENLYDKRPIDYYRAKYVDVPIYAAVRATFLDNKITPFVNARAGYYVTHHGGLYANAEVGCRFGIYERQAINVSVGYSYEQLAFWTNYVETTSGWGYATRKSLGTNAISFKVGYEF